MRLKIPVLMILSFGLGLLISAGAQKNTQSGCVPAPNWFKGACDRNGHCTFRGEYSDYVAKHPEESSEEK
jgi:hypothetical protein